MRQIRQVLRLFYDAKLSKRAIATCLGLSRDAVSDYIVRAAAMQITWPLSKEISDDELEQRLFPTTPHPQQFRKEQANWLKIHQELKRKGATLQVLHAEYNRECSNGMSYSNFCQQYRKFRSSLKRYMRQSYVAGEKVFVDYAGPTYTIFTLKTGESREAQIFVGVLGASSYIYAEAHWSQQEANWIAAHARMFEHFGCVPLAVVCDNLKSAVTRASRTDPLINPTYLNMADHYGTVIVPARGRKPKDKAKAENGVLIVERWILFRLRKKVFTSLAELNEAIRELLVDINNRPFQKIPGCRKILFETIDRPAMLPLPATGFEYAEFRKVRVGLDYRVEVDGCRYSVPFNLCKSEVELRLTANVVEVLYRGSRVASHVRNSGARDIVDPQHMESAHRHFGLWKAENALETAAQSGVFVRNFLEILLTRSVVREQGYRASNGLKKLEKEFGKDRLNAACCRAIEIGATSLANVRSILRNKIDLQPAKANEPLDANFDHANIRGSDYYH